MFTQDNYQSRGNRAVQVKLTPVVFHLVVQRGRLALKLGGNRN